MFKVDDAVREISTTTGAGTYTLGGTVAGFRPFSVIGANVYTRYFATDGVNREWGIGRYISGPDRLERTHVLGSTNGGAAVNWGVGTRTLRCGPIGAMEKPRVKSKDIAGTGTITLNQDEQRCDVLILTGALTGDRIVEVDDTPWSWSAIINNSTGSSTVIFRPAGQSGPEIYQGRATACVHDGTNVKKPGEDIPPGTIEEYGGIEAQPGRLKCDGSNQSRTTFAALFRKMIRSAIITFTNGTDRVNWATHGLAEGDVFKFTTSGTPPTGLVAGTTYFVINPTTNDFQVAATEGGAAINFTTDGTGTLTGIHAPFGDGDGATTFTLPDFRRRGAVGSAGSGTAQLRKAVGATGGAEAHTIGTTNLPASGLSVPSLSVSGSTADHSHNFPDSVQMKYGSAGTGGTYGNRIISGLNEGANTSTLSTAQSAAAPGALSVSGTTGTGTTGNMGSGTALDDMPPSLVVLKTIRT